ncbi:MAG TPA: ribose-5-phosphate isomerase RpiA [Thermoanaerobaculia bacterium]|nr:ribose-5-phosphate isomerase RpiA [Thermoanaerobaculia bacterium]
MATDLKELKIEAARIALGEIRSGMRLGLGTGSTAEELVRLLGAKVQSGELRDLQAACTSVVTERLATSFSIPIRPIEELPELDLAIDGADEIDPELRLVKGRGGALLREKIVEQAAKRFIVIADETKEVPRLGVGPFPVEVVRFASKLLLDRFTTLGWGPKLRMKDGAVFVTDEGHHTLDLALPANRDIADVVNDIRSHAGVVDTGFFPTEATEALIATTTGVKRRGRGKG